ncbi:(deoxy)nucleoside triphosphate pyrophosphohydrolase [Luteococcus peritonei]|uniref:8-oxo-dGTP diphosphatase n=1 Tax=Luteococcus peritonei TaxID=88874 RepID=A0ABW4RUM4_9ACTN
MSPRLVVGAIIVDDDRRVLAARRNRPAELALQWEFPGGKVEPGESPQQALEREVHEELGCRIQVHAEFESVDGAWPINDELELRVFFASLVAGEPLPGDSHDELSWVAPVDLDALVWLEADEPIARLLQQGLLR